MEGDKLTINQKVHRLRTRGRGFAKSGENTFQHYQYYTESDIFTVINPILDELGLVPDYQFEIIGSPEVWQEKNYRVRAYVTMVLWDADSSEYFKFGPILCSGADNSDKAEYKLNTGGVRTIWAKFFGLSNHDEPEREETVTRQPSRQPAKKQQEAWTSNSLFTAASAKGKLAEAQAMRHEGKSLEFIAETLTL